MWRDRTLGHASDGVGRRSTIDLDEVITDGFIRFRFKFVYPYRHMLDSGDAFKAERRQDLHFIDGMVSSVYGSVRREMMRGIGQDPGMDPVMISTYGNGSDDIDVAATGADPNSLSLGECRHWSMKRRVTLSIDHEVVGKCDRSPMLKERRTVFGLFSRSGFDDNVIGCAERNGILLVEGDRAVCRPMEGAAETDEAAHAALCAIVTAHG